MGKKAGGLLLVCASLAIGVLCIVAVYWGFVFLGAPSLAPRLVVLEGNVKIHFINIGLRNIELPLGEIEYLLIPPVDSSNHYVAQIRNNPHSAFRGRRTDDMVLLRPGESTEIGDLTPYLRGIPRGSIRISAIYSVPADYSRSPGIWRGFARALPITVEVI